MVVFNINRLYQPAVQSASFHAILPNKNSETTPYIYLGKRDAYYASWPIKLWISDTY